MRTLGLFLLMIAFFLLLLVSTYDAIEEQTVKLTPAKTLVMLPSSMELARACYERGGRPVVMEVKNGYAVVAYCEEETE